MVGARLVEDSSIKASGDWSSESSAFFIRELGPLTKARPETRSREHRDFICSSPPSAHSRTRIFCCELGGNRSHRTKLLAQPASHCPPSWGGGWKQEAEGTIRGNV